MKIKYKVTFSFVFLFVLFFLLSGHFLYNVSSTELKDFYYEVLSTRIHYRYKHLETHIQKNLEMLDLVTSRTQLRALLKAYDPGSPGETKVKLKAILIDAKTPIDNFISLSILDKSGRVLVSTNEDSEGGKAKNFDNYINSDPTGNRMFIALDNYSQPFLYLFGPVLSDGNVTGYLFIKSKPDNLWEITEDFGLSGEVFLLDSFGYFITPSRFLGEDVVLKKQVDTEIFGHCLEDRLLYRQTGDIEDVVNEMNHKHKSDTYLDYRGNKVIGTHLYIPQTDWCLITKVDESEATAQALNVLKVFLIIAGITIPVFILLAFYISRSIVGPLEKLKEDVEIVEKGDLNHGIDVSGKDEVGVLSRAFDKMIISVKKSRLDVDEKVKKQTSEIQEKALLMEDQRKALLNVMDEISDEKRIAETEREKVNTIIQSIGDGVFVINDKKELILINNVALEMSGYKKSDVLGKKYTDILRFEFEDNGKINDVFINNALNKGTKEEMSNHTVLIRANGKRISVADSAAPIKNDEGKVVGCVVVFRDVTKERIVENMKNDFLSISSHQLRTPLGSMRWNLEMLLNGDMGIIDDKIKDVVRDIYDNNNRMLALVNDLLDVSRIEENRVPDKPVKLKLGEIVESVIKDLTLTAKDKKVTIDYKGLDAEIVIDKERIREVIENLLSNAIKYNRQNGKVIVKLEEREESYIFTVEDTGIGIPEDEQKRLFEKFFRADNAVSSETEGSGLGLYVAKTYLESWGGSILCESKIGVGSKFIVKIPNKPISHVLDNNLKYSNNKVE